MRHLVPVRTTEFCSRTSCLHPTVIFPSVYRGSERFDAVLPLNDVAPGPVAHTRLSMMSASTTPNPELQSSDEIASNLRLSKQTEVGSGFPLRSSESPVRSRTQTNTSQTQSRASLSRETAPPLNDENESSSYREREVLAHEVLDTNLRSSPPFPASSERSAVSPAYKPQRNPSYSLDRSGWTNDEFSAAIPSSLTGLNTDSTTPNKPQPHGSSHHNGYACFTSPTIEKTTIESTTTIGTNIKNGGSIPEQETISEVENVYEREVKKYKAAKVSYFLILLELN
jgi:hypothetical protein